MSVSSNSSGKSKVSGEVDASNIQTKRRKSKATAKETSEEVEESTTQTTKKKTNKKTQKETENDSTSPDTSSTSARYFRNTQSTHCLPIQ